MELRFNEWVFSHDLAQARSDGGQTIKLAPQERAMLSCFIRSPGRLLSRERLHLSLRNENTEIGEQHITFLINRLRKLLGDDSRTPRFIATRYGSGYVWVAGKEELPATDAFVVIQTYLQRDNEARFEELLSHSLRQSMPSQHKIALAPHGWRPPANHNISFLLETCLYEENEQLHIALTLRNAATQAVIHTLRGTGAVAQGLDALAARFSAELQTHMWKSKALQNTTTVPDESPLEVRMHDASLLMFGDDYCTWEHSQRMVMNVMNGSNSITAEHHINQATILFTKTIQQGMKLAWLNAEQWDAIDQQIEHHVMTALPDLENQPILQLAAARLLLAIGHQHYPLAGELAQRAFMNSTAFAAAFSTLATYHLHIGELEKGIELLDRALEMAKFGSEFQVYLLVVKSSALIAMNDLQRLATCKEALYLAKPSCREELLIFLETPGRPRLNFIEISLVKKALNAKQATQLLYSAYRGTASKFINPQHCTNLMRGPFNVLSQVFGTDIAPPQILKTLVPVQATA